MKFVKTVDGQIYEVIHTNSVGLYKYVCKGEPCKLMLKAGKKKVVIDSNGLLFLTKNEVVEEFEKEIIINDDDEDYIGLTD